MNIIAIMGPHGVYHKDEPIKELEAALQRQGFQTILAAKQRRPAAVYRAQPAHLRGDLRLG
ncbi:Lysine decarboxylase 2, constitutive [Klebsiella pneumoniae subsp. pneumoniae]|uniref:Lysine decarboxylase 2, constitutive n=1 Tax=Klebsiella pneumoniae subsp. pneumoniae TaxID=72407 RepID=A0A378AEA4_KLEPN|nr:Lysine decarboxylase 2, constitutive [Klebsiella pneumoniae subsp. pneumoniae]